MATPVGHALAGAAVAVSVDGGRSTSRAIAAGALAGAAPDLDFLPGLLLGDPARFHHGISHSLGFALLVVGLAWLLASGDRWRWALAAGGAYVSHLVLDALTADPSAPVGIPLLWPVSGAHLISPVTPLPRVLHTSVNPINLHNFGVALLELVLFGLLLWLAVQAEARQSGG